MTRDNIEEQCRRISANYSSSGVCKFVRGGGVLCFIDASQTQNGTRGIAFMRDKMSVCLGGEEPVEVYFADIKELRIISSFEDFFADELSLVCDDGEVRISDYSLDKSELKRFIEELIVESEKARAHRAQAEEYAKIIAERLAQSTLREEREPISDAFALPAKDNELPKDDSSSADIEDEPPADEPIPAEVVPVIPETVIDVSAKAVNVPEDYKPAPIPDEEIKWISGSFYTNKREVHAETPIIAADELPETEKTAEEPIAEQPVEEQFITEPPITGQPTAERPASELPAEEPIIAERALTEEAIEQTDKESEDRELVVLYSRGESDGAPPVAERLWTAVDTESPDKAEEHASAAEAENELDGELLARLENMSREETLSFLANSLNEINGINESSDESEPEMPSETPSQTEDPLDMGIDLKTISEISAPPEDANDGKLSIEPIWGDIYIKASRNLRELIEGGKLSMDQIKAELKEKLLSSARAFAEITADTSKVPKVLMPRITELRSAAEDFDEYFKSGEDVGVRAMFFMMYQMLSYADRIAETPETKERLNDFFRRFGSAGITLSMLDMRV